MFLSIHTHSKAFPTQIRLNTGIIIHNFILLFVAFLYIYNIFSLNTCIPQSSFQRPRRTMLHANSALPAAGNIYRFIAL